MFHWIAILGFVAGVSVPAWGVTYLSIHAPAAGHAPNPAEPDIEADFSTQLSVLVAEDTPVNQLLIFAFLKKLGYRADIVADGVEVMEILSQRSCDVVLMDVHMPRLDGWDTARRIRSEFPPAKQPHIIAVTAGVLKEETDSCLHAGMDQFIGKPIVRNEVCDALVRAGKQRRAGSEHSTLPAALPRLDF